MEQPTVRQAVLDDLELLTPLFDAYRHFYGQPHDRETAEDFLRARLAQGDSVIFLAHDADLGVGFVQLYPLFSSVAAARTFVLNDLFVLEQARRRGIASRLLDAAIDYANRVGAVRLTLSTAADNAAARALYEAEGWQCDDAFAVYHFSLSG
ncbi:MAG: GNAT family N-acetyltransferase [Gammaproteobacteria bacterium]